MEHYAGIDVSLKESSVCVVDTKGQIVREAKIASEPEALVQFFDSLELPVSRIGLVLSRKWLEKAGQRFSGGLRVARQAARSIG